MSHVPRCSVTCELCWRCFRLSRERNWSGYDDVRYKMRWDAKLKWKQPWGQMSDDDLRSVNVYDLRVVKSNRRRNYRAVPNCKRFTVVMGKTCDPAEFIKQRVKWLCWAVSLAYAAVVLICSLRPDTAWSHKLSLLKETRSKNVFFYTLRFNLTTERRASATETSVVW